jgi:hypothetical protein
MFIILAPLQTKFMKTSFIVRKKSMVRSNAPCRTDLSDMDRRSLKAFARAAGLDADYQGVHVRASLPEA